MRFIRGIKINETQQYEVFSNEIEQNINFLENFSDLLTYNGRIISFITADKMYYLDTSLIDSAVRTLQSIKLCCSIGSFSDANSLVRKLRDDLLLYVYKLDVVNKRNPFEEDELSKIDMSDIPAAAKSLVEMKFRGLANDDEKAVEAWLNNSVEQLERKIKFKLSFENYMTYLKKDPLIDKVLTTYNLESYWEMLRLKLNDYVHNNGCQFTKHNLLRSDNKHLEVFFKNINIRTSYITTFFLILIIIVDGSLLSSTDMIDHLDMNMDPPEGAQYEIACFIQEYIDEKVVKLHPEIKQYLRDENKYGMRIN